MDLIFIGLLFLFFDIKINGITLLPAFVGYLLIFFGMRKFPTVLSYRAAAPAAIIGAAVSGGFWLANLGLFSYRSNFAAVVVGLCIQLFTTWQLAQGMWELEIQRKADLSAAILRRCWTVMAAASFLALVLARGEQAILAAASSLVGAAGAVVFVISFYNSKKLLDKAPEAQPPEEPEQPEKKG